MKEANKVWRIAPCAAYDIEETESWLMDMAAKGLWLSTDGIFWGMGIFSKTEPTTMRYRLIPAKSTTSMWAENQGEPDESAKELNACFGWQYLCNYGQFHIYCTTDPKARELDTDAQVQAVALEEVQKRERDMALLTVFWLLVYPLLYLKGNLMLLMVQVGSPLILFGLCLITIAFYKNVRKLLHLRALRKRLRKNELLDHTMPYQNKSWFHCVGKFILPLGTICWIVLFLIAYNRDLSKVDEIPLTSYQQAVPFATLQDFVSSGSYQLHDLSFTNTVKIKTDWLAPSVIEWHENAQIQLTDGQWFHGGLSVAYYQAKTSWMAREIAREYLRIDKRNRYYEVYPLPDLQVDYAIAYQADFMTLLIQNGNKVMRVFFYNTSDYPLANETWMRICAESIR